MWADQIGEREREGARPGAEVGPRAALALGDGAGKERDVIRVIHD
jgi:hypothetical protein